jgi:hypothetical protein
MVPNPAHQRVTHIVRLICGAKNELITVKGGMWYVPKGFVPLEWDRLYFS